MKYPHPFKLAWAFAAVISMLLLAGCTHMINLPKQPYTAYAPQERLPLKVAINITEELRNARMDRHSMGDNWVIPIGKALAENAPVLARHTFSEVVEINNGVLPIDRVDAILTPKVVYINQTVGATSFGKSIISIKVEWAFTEPSGDAVWVDTIDAESSGSTGWTKPEDILKVAWQELLRKSQAAVASSEAIVQFAQKKNPDKKLVVAAADTTLRNTEVEAVCMSLSSSDPGEVVHALKVLRAMNATEAIQKILPCLKHTDAHVLRDACRTLAVVADKNVLPSIEPLLTHSRKDVRKDAADAIAILKRK